MKNKKKEKIAVVLTAGEAASLRKILRRGTAKAREITRARILLLSHAGKTNREIMEALDCSHEIIRAVRRRYQERGSIEEAIADLPRPGQPKKITKAHEAFVTATACTDAPDGHDHWTLNALKNKLLETYDDLDSVSHEQIRRILIHQALKPWREKNVVHPEAHARISRAHG